MATCNKKVAEELLIELQDTLKPYPQIIEKAAESADDGQRIDSICERLGQAINLFKTVLR